MLRMVTPPRGDWMKIVESQDASTKALLEYYRDHRA